MYMYVEKQQFSRTANTKVGYGSFDYSWSDLYETDVFINQIFYFILILGFNPFALRTAKIPLSVGLSEYNRVKVTGKAKYSHS